VGEKMEKVTTENEPPKEKTYDEMNKEEKVNYLNELLK
jgi:hypothetical protein